MDLTVADVGKGGCTAIQQEVALQTMDYLGQHIGDKVTIREIAKTLHVSETHLKTSFRAYYGSSVYASFKRMKMEKAAGMLASTDRTVLAIAGGLGYENSSKFASAFRSVYSVSPSDYRADTRHRRGKSTKG